MALIIKGDMPTFCERLTEDGNNMEYCRFACVCESHNISTMAIPPDCPIIGEIPDEYGRLIDADIVADYYFNYLRVCSPLMDMEKAMEMVNTVKEACKIAPTVLEAST